MSGQFHAPAALQPGKEPPVPSGLEAGWPQSGSGRREEEKFLDLTGYRIPTPLLLLHFVFLSFPPMCE
jgi:hypothetical protein